VADVDSHKLRRVGSLDASESQGHGGVACHGSWRWFTQERLCCSGGTSSRCATRDVVIADQEEDCQGGLGGSEKHDHVKVANAQCLMTGFENITFKEGELVDDFSMRIESLAENQCALGESITDVRVAKKMLRVLSKRFSQIAVSIETLLDINSLTVEDFLVD
jgi:hypothetical protein